jgi:hypothetical protein
MYNFNVVRFGGASARVWCAGQPPRRRLGYRSTLMGDTYPCLVWEAAVRDGLTPNPNQNSTGSKIAGRI